ncbi:MobA/MobL family protein [Marinobacter vinifirmus]|uniref:MobA/MobL protein domain-containing protein n=1 Tax=Marinobacter vinifirmus TaxID=355591 RepID=A0A558B271_9GAMM|nr:MobA/MobL family protein [Marinobacter vinifirmus]TVT30614.1 MAG: hypothetical protein FHK81_16605 [Marinobacter vinifirmus]
MAIYHLSAKPVQRSAGKSAVAAAAYRSRSTLRDERQAMTFSYTAATDLVHSEIVGFKGDRGTLWNIAESMEKRKDATTAREYEIALPRELSVPDQIQLSRAFAAWLTKEQGCVVDFAIHSGSTADADKETNPHVHMLTTTRAVDELGTMSEIKIPREWSDKKRKEHNLPPRRTELTRVREQWALMANAALAKAGFDSRIDHRSYADQGIDRLPTSHLGPTVSTMERAGIKTRAGNQNRAIIDLNLRRQHELDELRHRQKSVQKLNNELALIDIEIKKIRKELKLDSTGQRGISGVVEMSRIQPDIASLADQQEQRFSTGLASSIGAKYKAKLFRDTWHFDLNKSILPSLRWVDVNAKALTLKSGEQVQDKGNEVTLTQGSEDGIAAAIMLAKAKSWESVLVRGSDEFQIRVSLALLEAGITPLPTTENAKKKLREELQKPTSQSPSKFDQSVQKSEPALPEEAAPISPERKSGRKEKMTPKICRDALKDRVMQVVMQAPPAHTNPFRDDSDVLRKWAANRWREVIRKEHGKCLHEVFVEAITQQALLAGYSNGEIHATLADQRSNKTILDSTSPATRTNNRLSSQQRRTEQGKMMIGP